MFHINICLSIFLFTSFSGLCFLFLTVFVWTSVYLFLYSHLFLVNVRCVSQCHQNASLNVTSVIITVKNHMRIFWFVCIFLYFLCFIFFVCFLFRVVVAVSPLCYMLRRFWAPTPDLASESDQLYSHVHSQSYIPMYVHSQSRWRVYNLTIVFSCTSSISLKSVGTSTISSEKCLVKNLSSKSSKNLISKCVF